MSRVIITKYLGPTDTKPGRIKAYMKDHPGSLAISYDHEIGDRSHQRAAELLAEKVGWGGDWFGGTLDTESMVWVRQDHQKSFIAVRRQHETH